MGNTCSKLSDTSLIVESARITGVAVSRVAAQPFSAIENLHPTHVTMADNPVGSGKHLKTTSQIVPFVSSSKDMSPVRAAFVKSAKPVVLCVEDDEDQLLLLKGMLEQSGFGVLQAKTAKVGLRLFHENPVSLVVIDQRLGKKKMTGAQLAREIKALKPNVPVVIRTGYPPESMENWDVFINKGEPMEGFLTIVRDLIQRYVA